jgi:AhpD family alkylhydroperoxidase
VLPARIKELMALTIAVVKHCDGCIAYHAKAAARRGATSEEVAGVWLMDGGTASVYAHEPRVRWRLGWCSVRAGFFHAVRVALGGDDVGVVARSR